MTNVDFTVLTDLGELDPDYIAELLKDDDTTIKLIHDGEELYEGSFLATDPEMIDCGAYKKARFHADLMCKTQVPDSNQVDTIEEDTFQEDSGRENESEDDKITFTLVDGPKDN
jgi:hypothetical protein